MVDELQVEFMDETWSIPPGGSLDFGRHADIEVDDNPYLHKRLGRFEHRSGLWFLVNVGRSLHISVLDEGTQTQATISPGRELALTFAPATVRFRAGKSTYELRVVAPAGQASTSRVEDETANTITASGIPLTPDQRLLIVALSEPVLREPGSTIRIPPSKEAAARLGWTLTRFNRKLDNVCHKLKKAGVPGLHGGPDKLASDRRSVLVQFAVQSGLVSTDDLALLGS